MCSLTRAKTVCVDECLALWIKSGYKGGRSVLVTYTRSLASTQTPYPKHHPLVSADGVRRIS